MRILRISLISFICHARDGFNKLQKYKIPDGPKNKTVGPQECSQPSKISHIIVLIGQNMENPVS